MKRADRTIQPFHDMGLDLFIGERDEHEYAGCGNMGDDLFPGDLFFMISWKITIRTSFFHYSTCGHRCVERSLNQVRERERTLHL